MSSDLSLSPSWQLTVPGTLDDSSLQAIRTLHEGGRFTVGAAGADLQIGDPYGRPVYCELHALGDVVRVTCFSEARGAWVFTPRDEQREDLAFRVNLRGLYAEHAASAIRDPHAPERLWLRTESSVLTESTSRFHWLTARDEPSVDVSDFAVLLIPGAQIVIERLVSTGRSASSVMRRNRAAASINQSPLVAYTVRPNLEQLVKQASDLHTLESAVDGVLLQSQGNRILAHGTRQLPNGPWLLPPKSPNEAPRRCESLDTVLDAFFAEAPELQASAELFEVPLMLRDTGKSVEPYALLVFRPDRRNDVLMLYSLRDGDRGRGVGSLIAERFGRLCPRTRTSAWNNAPPSTTSIWSQPPELRTWKGFEQELETLVALFPDARLRPTERVWQQVRTHVAQHSNDPAVIEAEVAEAVSYIAWKRRDLALAGYVAYESLRSRLRTLTDEGVSLRRLNAPQIADLMEISVLAMNHGIIGDDNRQKLLRRLAHLYLMIAPSSAEGSARQVLLPSGFVFHLDATAVDLHEQWLQEGAAKRGDKRLFDLIVAPAEVFQHARTLLLDRGARVPESAWEDLTARLERMTSASV